MRLNAMHRMSQGSPDESEQNQLIPNRQAFLRDKIGAEC